MLVCGVSDGRGSVVSTTMSCIAMQQPCTDTHALPTPPHQPHHPSVPSLITVTFITPHIQPPPPPNQQHSRGFREPQRQEQRRRVPHPQRPRLVAVTGDDLVGGGGVAVPEQSRLPARHGRDSRKESVTLSAQRMLCTTGHMAHGAKRASDLFVSNTAH